MTAKPLLKSLLRAAVLAAFAVYPFAVLFFLSRNDIRTASCVLAASAVAAALVKRSRLSVCCAALAAALAAITWATGADRAIRLYPVFVNAALLTVFAVSLESRPVCEVFARIAEPELPASGVRYCRRLTVFWCGFFVVNGLIALDSALFRSAQWWAVYNGGIAYGLIGLIFVLEYALRLYLRRADRTEIS